MRLVKDNVVKVKTDETAIKRLIEAGYVPETAAPKTKKINTLKRGFKSMSYSELQEAAKNKGIKAGGVKKDELIELLVGVANDINS